MITKNGEQGPNSIHTISPGTAPSFMEQFPDYTSGCSPDVFILNKHIFVLVAADNRILIGKYFWHNDVAGMNDEALKLGESCSPIKIGVKFFV